MKFTIHTNVDYGSVAIMDGSMTIDRITEEGYESVGFLQTTPNAIVITSTPRGMEHIQLNFNLRDYLEEVQDILTIDTPSGFLLIEDWNDSSYAKIPCGKQVSIMVMEDPLKSIYDIWIGLGK